MADARRAALKASLKTGERSFETRHRRTPVAPDVAGELDIAQLPTSSVPLSVLTSHSAVKLGMLVAPMPVNVTEARKVAGAEDDDEWARPNANAMRRFSRLASTVTVEHTMAVPISTLTPADQPATVVQPDENTEPATVKTTEKCLAKKTKMIRKRTAASTKDDPAPVTNSWGSALRANKRKRITTTTTSAGKAARGKTPAMDEALQRPGQKISLLDTSRQVSDNFKKFNLTSRKGGRGRGGAGGRFERFRKPNYGKPVIRGRAGGTDDTIVGTSDINGDEVPFAIWSNCVDPVPSMTAEPTPPPPPESGLEGILAGDSTDSGGDGDLLDLLRKLYGHTSFRPGQETAIKKILEGKSTLLVLGTGSGKSLCYQLPAYKLAKERNAFTIVVSPLISLMMDQMRTLPKGLSGVILHGQLDQTATDKVLDQLDAGKYDILFVSPEKLLSMHLRRRLKGVTRPLGFVCVDEVHCASEWSHNFRPSYLRLGDMLRSTFGQPCVLGLSATLTLTAQQDVVRIFNFASIQRGNLLRPNVQWRVYKGTGQDRITWLVHQLKTHFQPTDSVIVYCTKQNQADEVAMALRTRMFDALSYHAGKSAEDREFVQAQFTKDQVPIVVATVAFGLGLDKPNVRGVIHLNLPKSVENFVQETGRAGRDGQIAKCLAYVDRHDYEHLRSLCFSCSVHMRSLEGLLEALTPKTNDSEGNPVFAPLRVDVAAVAWDLRRETLETLLSHLEQHPSGAIVTSPATYVNATVCFYKGLNDNEDDEFVKRLVAVAKPLPARRRGQSNGSKSIVAASLIDLLEPGDTLRDVVKQLWMRQKDRKLKYELADLAIPVEVHPRYFDRDALLADLQSLVGKLEATSTTKVDQIYTVLLKATELSSDFEVDEQQQFLSTAVEAYFGQTTCEPIAPNLSECSKAKLVMMSADVRLFVQQHREQLDTSLSVARILHGLSSPRYPSIDWFRSPFWGRYTDMPLEILRRTAARALGEDGTPIPTAVTRKRPVFSSDEDDEDDMRANLRSKRVATVPQIRTIIDEKDEFDF